MYLVIGVSGPIVTFVDPNSMRNWLGSASPSLLRNLELWYVPVGWTKLRAKKLRLKDFID